jgi:hypothetical protein
MWLHWPWSRWAVVIPPSPVSTRMALSHFGCPLRVGRVGLGFRGRQVTRTYHRICYPTCSGGLGWSRGTSLGLRRVSSPQSLNNGHSI